MVLVLPDPLGPMNPKISPSRTSKLRSCTSTLSSIRLVTWSTWITGGRACTGEGLRLCILINNATQFLGVRRKLIEAATQHNPVSVSLLYKLDGYQPLHYKALRF